MRNFFAFVFTTTLIFTFAACGTYQYKDVAPLPPPTRGITTRDVAHDPPPTHTTDAYDRFSYTPDIPPMPADLQPITRSTPPVATTQVVPPTPTPRTEMASYETTFDPNEEGRNTNIKLAAASVHGHIVHPGETFSFNEVVGPTNQARGYEKSMIFIDGEKHQGFGGGVCQVSTTIFNAAEDAGMTILERHDHSRPVLYAESGDEAATSYGGIDFKFKNEKNHAIVITCMVDNGTIRATIKPLG